jgi:hypothetical protein
MKYLIIHQTSGNENEKIKNIYHSHVKKYGRIFYACIIDREGEIHEIHTQFNDRGKEGKSLDVAVMGNFIKEKPSQKQIAALDKLTKKLIKRHHFEAMLPHRYIENYGLRGTRVPCPGLVWEALLEYRWLKKSQK